MTTKITKTIELRKNVDIKITIKEQSEKLDRINQEIQDSDKQKQVVLARLVSQKYGKLVYVPQVLIRQSQ